ncbi:Rieske 2Fe-2S domain-containing protein [Rhizobium lusitanum]|uniref:Phenylpropionate dioxygenase-like ring-hydroxylating dioxygenase large terminal subunit n=1 Tax=Rhizobium lusitanum TaxID=293958 RepID=A0A7X0ITM3_9HYPH|nr:Rieske 2Fe-2S domain-containing protein [Rhizobium lusitanum]MBB6486800.1 phenylpropionate dioxygenase-like ring-hydroxylating dioxygenase large terminal subunit [Rhizobium lusitanum]
MSDQKIEGWVAIAQSRAVRNKPLRVLVGGRAFVLFRADGKLHCLADICPHRSAPLSHGRVVDGAIECPYHGWRFDGAGACKAMPGLVGAIPRTLVPSYGVCEKDGLVFFSAHAVDAIPYTTVLAAADTVSMTVESRVTSSLAEVAENILDATHTHFTHRGILRGLSARRYRVTVTVTGGDGWVEARYVGEPKQEGLVSRLLEGERSISIGRFRYPGIAELEFWGAKSINLATTFHLRQETDDMVHGFGILSGPRQRNFGYLKALLFKPFFRIALRQDQHILHAAEKNRRLFGQRRPMIGPLDIMRPHIDAILSGQRPEVAEKPTILVMEL